MRPCEFITLIGGAAAWPLVVRAQRAEAIGVACVVVRRPRESVVWIVGLLEVGYAFR
jgi:hypothetical protein